MWVWDSTNTHNILFIILNRKHGASVGSLHPLAERSASQMPNTIPQLQTSSAFFMEWVRKCSHCETGRTYNCAGHRSNPCSYLPTSQRSKELSSSVGHSHQSSLYAPAAACQLLSARSCLPFLSGVRFPPVGHMPQILPSHPCSYLPTSRRRQPTVRIFFQVDTHN